MKKIYRLFNIKFLEIETLSQEQARTEKILKSHNPEGAILDVSQVELDKEAEKETLRKMEGK